jgi:hypothetical protein
MKAIALTEDTPYTQLTLQQKNFVEARMQGLAPPAAARAAGAKYQEGASVLEKNPKVRAAIRYLIRESTLNVRELTKSDVMTGMLDAVEAAATSAELVMAWRELGKLIGAYEPEKKILEIHDYTGDELKELSDKDLLRLAGGRMQDTIIEGEYEDLATSHVARNSDAE